MSDVTIIGGGPVGLCFGLAAARCGLRVVVLESRKAGSGLDDRRAIALSWGSVLKLARLGIDLRDDAAASPIRSIHVSRTGSIGRTLLSAGDAGVPSLGFVLPYGDIVRRLEAAAQACLDVRYDATVETLDTDNVAVEIRSSAGLLRTPVAVIADGGGDLLRSAGFEMDVRDYGVRAVVARVGCDRPAGTLAYERFSSPGPLALLPSQGQYALIWTESPERSSDLQNCDPVRFLRELQDAFGWRAGRFVEVHDRGAYPLRARRTHPIVLGRIAVIGNAAQTLHPVAGQGLNLGLRDAWSLSECLAAEPDSPVEALRRFAVRRQPDRDFTMGFTDLLARGFAPDWPGLGLARGVALEFLDVVPLARRVFARTLSIATRR